jgi:hypothetical protein
MIFVTEENLNIIEDFPSGRKYVFPLKMDHFDLLIVGLLNFLIGLILILTYAFTKEIVILYISLAFFFFAFIGSLIPFYGYIIGSRLVVSKEGVFVKRFFGKQEEFSWDDVEDVVIKQSYSTKPIIVTIDNAPLTKYTVIRKYTVHFNLKSGKTIIINPNKFSWKELPLEKLGKRHSRKLLKAIFLQRFHTIIKKS